MIKTMQKIILLLLPFVFSSCVYSMYINHKTLNQNKQVIPRAKVFIEENAHLLDILRYGEYSENDMHEIAQRDFGPHSDKDGFSSYIVVDGRRHKVPLYSEELIEYLPQKEIDTFLYLRGLSLTETNDLEFIFGEIYGGWYRFAVIRIDGIDVYVTTEPIKISPKSYMEQAGDYYVQVIAYLPEANTGPL